MSYSSVRLSVANAQFALDLYKQCSSASDVDNIFMSPLSVSVALGMTYLGARGETQSQMRAVMHLGDLDDSDVHDSFAAINSAVNDRAQNAYKLFMANRLFGEQTYTFLEEFLAAGRKHYGAELAAVDFR